jgi:phosphate starvation-inducible protein PhoH
VVRHPLVSKIVKAYSKNDKYWSFFRRESLVKKT